jgi:PPK2 family polyphosphate:nucleotide phosphotransferase
MAGSAPVAKKRRAVNFRKRFHAEPGKRVRLKEIDAAYTGNVRSSEEAQPKLDRDCDRLSHLQYLMYAEARRSLLIVLQAPDAGGKDGTVKHVFGSLNPQGATVHAFKVPTPLEAAHDFLWRAHQATPALGRIAIFNRSHYEDVLVPRAHRTVAKDVIEKRCNRINEFEKNLAQNGTLILKFFLHISADEQLRRFKARLEDPNRQWKISEADYAERPHWDDYRKAYEDAIERTTTRQAPWYVIPSDHKWFRNLAVARIVTDALDELNMQFPKPSVDVEEIRRKYHQAAGE